jgi:hypothetical protein
MIDITNRRDLVRYLKSYEYLKHELDDIETSQLPRTPQISGDGSHSHITSKSMSYAILIDKRDEIVDEMREISSVINCISDPISRSIIEGKFIFFKSLEDLAIQYQRSVTTIKKHYNRGIDEIMRTYTKVSDNVKN